MAYSVAANTRLAGAPKGIFQDDLTNPTIGEWPKTQAIKAITRIAVYTGNIIDSVRITYKLENGTTPTVQHGGNGGNQTLNFQITADENLIAVYGHRHVEATEYGDKNIVSLSFVVANTSAKVVTVKIHTASGLSPETTEKFEFSWALVAATSYTFQEQGQPNAYLQAIGFSKVLDQASAPLI